MSEHEAERRRFWDAVATQLIGSVGEVTDFADRVLAERDKRFPPPTAAPEPAPESGDLVPCPVCGKQPEWREACRDYICFHENTEFNDTIVFVCTLGNKSKREARAAWNSMRRDAPVTPKVPA